MIDKVFPKIHDEGYKFIVIFGLVTIILYFISNFIGLVGLVLTIWCYYFFRDPERFPINDENYLVSPADGLILQVQDSDGPKELSMEGKKFIEDRLGYLQEVALEFRGIDLSEKPIPITSLSFNELFFSKFFTISMLLLVISLLISDISVEVL